MKEILDFIGKHERVQFSMLTNGFLLTDELVSKANKLENLDVTVSVYGKDHDEFSFITNSSLTEMDYSTCMLRIFKSGFRLAYRSYQDYDGVVLENDVKSCRMKTCFFDWLNYPNSEKKEIEDTKHYLGIEDLDCSAFISPHIRYDGKIAMCSCADVDGRFIIGQFEYDDSGKIRMVVDDKFLRNIIVDYASGGLEKVLPCSNCDFPLSVILNGTDVDHRIQDKSGRLEYISRWYEFFTHDRKFFNILSRMSSKRG
jgi:hypothetical protein